MNEYTVSLVEQSFLSASLADPAAELRRQLLAFASPPRAGATVAIAVGSRGIGHLSAYISEVVAWVKSHGASPFIVPAMGSHGGATAAGQQTLLAGYGITEEVIGAPIHSSMDVVELPMGDAGVPVYCDRYAFQADHIIVINRIKPHTSFHGRYESGLMKMLAIGLGKQRQAEAIHRLGVDGLREVMPKVARQVLAHAPIYLGIGIIEDARELTHAIALLRPAEIPETEPALLEMARRLMPKLPLEDLDLLIVDEMGKDISGLGMDPNIIGRLKILGQAEPETPRIKVILVRALSAHAQGNAAGMGLADLITRRFADAIDFDATYANVLTTGFLERGKMPIVMPNERDAIRMSLHAVNRPWQHARVLHIRNTLRLDQLHASPALLEEIGQRPTCRILSQPLPLFDGETIRELPN